MRNQRPLQVALRKGNLNPDMWLIGTSLSSQFRVWWLLLLQQSTHTSSGMQRDKS